VVFEKVISIHNTMQSLKKLSTSARFLRKLIYSLPASKRSVDVAAPTAWNSLASYLHRIDDTATFTRYLKTYPFALAFKFKMFIIVIFF